MTMILRLCPVGILMLSSVTSVEADMFEQTIQPLLRDVLRHLSFD